MNARVMQIHILPGKLQEYLAATNSLRPVLRKQSGFRALLVLCSAETPPSTNDSRETMATTISVWESLEALRASEKNLFLYQALARMMQFCKGFPQIREEEVLTCELNAPIFTHAADETQG
jgi:heme-degrading monooxygenase HmoA